MQMGDRTGALPHYQRASQLSPRDAEFRLKYGSLLAEKSPSDGVRELEQAAQLAPDRPDILTALGTALRRAGDQEQAAEVFRRSRAASTAVSQRSEAMSDTDKAIDSLKKGQVPPAIEFLRAALAADPNFADANHYMGIAQSAQQNWSEANRAFNAAVLESPSNPEIHFNFAISLEKQGDWEAAAREFQSAADLRPGQVPVMCQLAGALVRAGQTERAQAEMEKVKELGSCDAPPGKP
jgi:Tfp pilus assembly protein PilF